MAITRKGTNVLVFGSGDIGYGISTSCVLELWLVQISVFFALSLSLSFSRSFSPNPFLRDRTSLAETHRAR